MNRIFEITELEEISLKMEPESPEKLLSWALDNFGDRVALACSFGAEDVVLVDMLMSINPRTRILTLDTGRIPEETYTLWNEIIEKYGCAIEAFFPPAEEVEKMIKDLGPNLFYQSLEARKRCCHVRKMLGLKRAFSSLDAWICGLRREQSVTREHIRKIELDGANRIIKLNPLASWSEADIWSYIRKNKVPYNKLHDRNYPSIGCEPCTRAIAEGEDIRAGRWWWENPETKECGLHTCARESSMIKGSR